MAITVGKVLTKIFGSRNERLLKRYHRIVNQINAREADVEKMTDEQLAARTAELRSALLSGKQRPADLIPEAFAIIRESMDRNIGIREIFSDEETLEIGRPKFDRTRLEPKELAAYDAVQQRMIATGESWRKVPFPLELYAAVKRLYPESRPPFRARCFDVQLIGGLVL